MPCRTTIPYSANSPRIWLAWARSRHEARAVDQTPCACREPGVWFRDFGSSYQAPCTDRIATALEDGSAVPNPLPGHRRYEREGSTTSVPLCRWGRSAAFIPHSRETANFKTFGETMRDTFLVTVGLPWSNTAPDRFPDHRLHPAFATAESVQFSGANRSSVDDVIPRRPRTIGRGPVHE